MYRGNQDYSMFVSSAAVSEYSGMRVNLKFQMCLHLKCNQELCPGDLYTKVSYKLNP